MPKQCPIRPRALRCDRFIPDASLSPAKLGEMERRTTDVLKNSLLPGQKDSLKTRPDGTILDGHHRIYILRKRGVAVDLLPREIVVKGIS
jgi:hypothetical protein